MKKITWTAFVLLMVFLNGVLFANATSRIPFTDETPYVAKINCPNMAEDSAAHLRLATFNYREDGTLRLVYHCKANGY
jgi:hypothetical protein